MKSKPLNFKSERMFGEEHKESIGTSRALQHTQTIKLIHLGCLNSKVCYMISGYLCHNIFYSWLPDCKAHSQFFSKIKEIL